MIENILKLDLYLFVKVHEKNNLVLDGGEEVVLVDELVNVLVPQSQVDFQSSVVPLVVRVPAEATSAAKLPLLIKAGRKRMFPAIQLKFCIFLSTTHSSASVVSKVLLV